MQTHTCPACDHEFDEPARDQSGPCCPRCGDPISVYTARRPPGIPVETYVGAAVGGAALGLLAAGVLLLGSW